jgi:hypothetical protein
MFLQVSAKKRRLPAGSGLSHFGRSAFHPEGKMNNGVYQTQNSQKMAKKAGLRRLFP